jgi:hypothetical protein
MPSAPIAPSTHAATAPVTLTVPTAAHETDVPAQQPGAGPRSQGAPADAPPARPDAASATPADPAPRQPPSALGKFGRALAQSAPVHAVAQGARAVADLVPHRQLGQMASRLRADNSPGAAAIRDVVQTLHHQLTQAQPADRPRLQLAAHHALLQHQAHSASIGDRVIPVLSETAAGGVYNLVAYGLGRPTGLAAATALMQKVHGEHIDLGWHAPAPPPGSKPPSGERSMQNLAAQWAIGSALGAVGDIAAQHLLLPMFDAVSRQLGPTHAEAVVPDETRALMNRLERGSGDALRAQVTRDQTELSAPASETNIGIAQKAFGAAAVLQTVINAGRPYGFAGTVGGIAASAGIPGAAQAGAIAINKALGTIAVPDLASLRAAVAQGVPLEQVKRNEVPLFYVEHKNSPNVLDALTNALRQDALLDPPSQNPSVPAAQRAAGAIVGTASNVTTAQAQRTVQVARATLPAAMFFATLGPTAASVSDPAAKAAINAVGTGLAIYSIVRGWATEIQNSVGQSDAALGAHRQRAVAAAAEQDRRVPATPVASTVGADGVVELDLTRSATTASAAATPPPTLPASKSTASSGSDATEFHSTRSRFSTDLPPN